MKAIVSGKEPEPEKTEKTEIETKEKPAPEKKPADVLQLAPEARTALAAMLNAGQLTELAKAIGADAKAVDASAAKLSLSRKRLGEAAEKEKAAQSIREECKREFGSPFKARKAVDEGRFADAAQWIADTLRMDFATFTRHVATATKGMDPKELERFQKDRELKERETALEAKERRTTEAKTKEELEARSLKVIEAKCAGLPALKIRGGARLILRRMEESFDEKTGVLGLGYKQAAEQIMDEFEADARAAGYSRGAPAPEKKPETKAETKPKGKEPFEAPAGERTESAPATGGRRKGSTLEERQARADRQFQRSRPL